MFLEELLQRGRAKPLMGEWVIEQLRTKPCGINMPYVFIVMDIVIPVVRTEPSPGNGGQHGA